MLKDAVSKVKRSGYFVVVATSLMRLFKFFTYN